MSLNKVYKRSVMEFRNRQRFCNESMFLTDFVGTSNRKEDGQTGLPTQQQCNIRR